MTSKKRRKPGRWAHLGYAQGGLIVRGQIIGHVGGFSNHTNMAMLNNINTGSIGNPTINFYQTPTPTPVCNARRGGPDSKIYCEVYKHVEHKQHTGRGKTGRWYSWD